MAIFVFEQESFYPKLRAHCFLPTLCHHLFECPIHHDVLQIQQHLIVTAILHSRGQLPCSRLAVRADIV